MSFNPEDECQDPDYQPARKQTFQMNRGPAPHEAPAPPSRTSSSAEFAPLLQAFRDQLIACLEECATGRRGLFTDLEHVAEEGANLCTWPEAAQLRQLAFALQAILAQSGESESSPDPLVDQFLDLCSIHGESDPGEPRLARAFLAEIEGKP